MRVSWSPHEKMYWLHCRKDSISKCSMFMWVYAQQKKGEITIRSSLNH